MDRATVITIDMGGTSFDLSLSKGGRVNISKDFDFMALSRRYSDARGRHARRGGGGSIACVNPMGLLQVGPESARAQPGPAAYGRGGDCATVTDALVVLGYLNPKALLGGRLPLDADAARSVVTERVAVPLGLSLEQAASGIFKLVNANMVSGIRRVSIERGHDPRDFVLVRRRGRRCGSCGDARRRTRYSDGLDPQDGIGVLRLWRDFFGPETQLPLVLRQSSRTASSTHESIGLFRDMERRGQQALVDVGLAAGDIGIHRSMDMRYVDQIHECQVDVPTVDFNSDNIRDAGFNPFIAVT